MVSSFLAIALFQSQRPEMPDIAVQPLAAKIRRVAAIIGMPEAPQESFRGRPALRGFAFAVNEIDSLWWNALFTESGRCQLIHPSAHAPTPSCPTDRQLQVAQRILNVLAPDYRATFTRKVLPGLGNGVYEGEVAYEFAQFFNGIPSALPLTVKFRKNQFASARIYQRLLPPDHWRLNFDLQRARAIALQEVFSRRPVLDLEVLNSGFKSVGVLRTPEWKTNQPPDEVQSQIGFQFEFRCYEDPGVTWDRQVFVSAQTDQTHITGPIPPYFGKAKSQEIRRADLAADSKLVWMGDFISLPSNLKRLPVTKRDAGAITVVVVGKKAFRAKLSKSDKSLTIGGTSYALPSPWVKRLR